MRMKKMLVVILWAFVSIAYAQEYKPMLTDGKEWLCMLEIEGSPDGADGKWPYKITVCGESVEDGRIFKKLKKEYTDSVPKNEQKISYSVAYEENGQVFRKYDFDFEGENILLILDFNLKKGDVATRLGEVVTDVDYVEAYGVRRKRLKIGDSGFYWVEGIGCDDENGLAPRIPIPTFRICSRILKCYEGGELVFTDKDFLTNTTSIGRVADDIIQTEYLYNLQGERVFRPSRGIYIKGSRKVVIR